MTHSHQLPRVLWLLTSTWLAGCGRLGFDALGDDPAGPLADAPLADAAVADAPDIDAPPIPGPGAPVAVLSIPVMMTTTCGNPPTVVSAQIANTGGSELVVTGATVMGDTFQVRAPWPLRIAPGTSAGVTITTPPAVVGTDVGGAQKRAVVMLATNTPNPTPAVDLVATIMGANLAIMSPSPPVLSLDGSSGACPLPKPITVVNQGNVAVPVGGQASSGFGFASGSSATIGGGASATFDIKVVTSQQCAGSGVISYTVVQGPNCGGSGTITSVNATFNISGTSSCLCS